MKRHAIAASLALFNFHTALAQSPLDPTSADHAMLGCREMATKSNRHTELQRECASTVRTMMYVAAGRGICPPHGATVENAIRVIVVYIDHRPERMQDQFEALAFEALQQSWPCRR
jgi:Rap1a immunity proteins